MTERDKYIHGIGRGNNVDGICGYGIVITSSDLSNLVLAGAYTRD